MTSSDRPSPCAERRLLACVCLVLASLQILDLHSSLRAASNGRAETNAVIIWVAYHFGFTMAVIASKVAALVALIAYFRVVSRFNSLLWPAMSIVAVCVIYIAIVFNNYS